MRKFLLHILFTVFCFVCALTLSAQNLGISAPGSTAYPQTNIGNTLTEAGANAGNFLIFNRLPQPFLLLRLRLERTAVQTGTIKRYYLQ